jgi:PAS domain S-box-containing protein
MGERKRVASETRGLEADDLETSRIRETLHRIGGALTAELDLEKVVQRLIDEATELCRAQFGAFFYTEVNPAGGSLLLYTLSGAPREAFSKFPIPRQTELFGPIFRGEGVVRSDDVTKDPRYGHNPPYHGMPEGHLPVRSYLALPVISRSGEVLGGLFFGHAEPGVFTELDERLIVAVAAQAAIAIDNARLYETARSAELAARRSEERFRSLVTATTQIVWTVNPSGDVVEDSPTWRAFTGQDYAQFENRGWMKALHPEDRERVRREWSRSLTLAEPYHSEYRIRRRDGEYRLTRVRGVPVRNEDGTVREWIGTNEDITEARFAEEALEVLAEASRLFASSLDFEDSLQQVMALVVPRFADSCFADLVENGTTRRIAESHRDPRRASSAASSARCRTGTTAASGSACGSFRR